MLVFDVATILFIIATSFMARAPWLEWLDLIFGLLILADFSRSRLYAKPSATLCSSSPILRLGPTWLRFFPSSPLWSVKVWASCHDVRLLHTYQLDATACRQLVFRRNEEAIIAVVNLGVFLFIMTGIVYEIQHWRNPEIANYFDALYFTVWALTTTGFGDIALKGSLGRLISILIMIFGVTLFLRLLQACSAHSR